MKRFLIIRFSSMGDIVLTSPVVRCLKKAYPESEIHFLTKASFSAILNANPHLTKVWEWSDDASKEILRELRELSFDHIIDLHHNLRTLRVKQALRRPSTSFKKLNLEKYLMVRFKINRLPDKHIVDRYIDTLSDLGVQNDNLGLDYFINPKDEFDLIELPGNFQKGYIALVAGALKGTKQMPLESLETLIEKLNMPILVLGGEQEKAIGESLAKRFPDKLMNFCGKLSLGGSASLIRQSRVVISHDTGLMHIAAAFKKPIISIWGNTIPEFGMSPYYGNSEVSQYKAQVDGLSCRPCSKIGFEECPKGHFKCMKNQNLHEIALQAKDYFKKA